MKSQCPLRTLRAMVECGEPYLAESGTRVKWEKPAAARRSCCFTSSAPAAVLNRTLTCLTLDPLHGKQIFHAQLMVWGRELQSVAHSKISFQLTETDDEAAFSDELLTTVTACVPLPAFQAAMVPSRVPKRNRADTPSGRLKPVPALLYTVPLGLPFAEASEAAGIVTFGITVAPAEVSTFTKPLPAASIHMAGPTETPQGLISVGSVTDAVPVTSEIMFVCTYVVVWASAVIESMTQQIARIAIRTTELCPEVGVTRTLVPKKRAFC